MLLSAAHDIADIRYTDSLFWVAVEYTFFYSYDIGIVLMLTPTENSRLKELLACAEQQDQVLNLVELHGFLYGLAITPEAIEPSEWLPQVFGHETYTFTDGKQGEHLVSDLLTIFSRVASLHQQDLLHFPYCLKEPSEETVANALDWGFGFNLALEMRPEIWLGNGPMDKDTDDDCLFASFSVLNGIAWADEVDELCADEECLNQPKDECELLATLLVALPEAVDTIQGYAARLETRPTRIGRNEPCPCGNNSKFKNCCADGHSTLH